MAFSLRCPECREKFPWEPKKSWPRYCPCCRADINNDRDDDDIVMPFIRHSSTKKNDALYREMEAGSEVRAQAAAEMAGCDVSDMGGLKMTNMNDRNDCEIGHVELPSNEVGAAMAKSPVPMGFSGGLPALPGGLPGGAATQIQQSIRNNHSSLVPLHTRPSKVG